MPVIRRCIRCQVSVVVDPLDTAMLSLDYTCAKCAALGRRTEGDPGKAEADAPVEIEDASTDGVTVDVKVPLP